MHTSLPCIAHRFPSEPWILIASCQTFWMGVQSDIMQAMSAQSPSTTFVQESPHVRACRGRFGPDFIPPGFLHQPFASLALPLHLIQITRAARLKLQPIKTISLEDKSTAILSCDSITPRANWYICKLIGYFQNSNLA